MNRYFSPYTLVLPALLVSGLYIVGFLLCDSYLAYQFNHSELFHLFPINLVLTSRPLLYTFVGVYLFFNLGTMIRRVYLTDLNEQVFWGALNRLLLSMGISLIFLKAGLPGGTEPGMYFSIGFVSNIFLEWVLDNTLKVLNLGKPKQADLPL